jgi:hypothetical protein
MRVCFSLISYCLRRAARVRGRDLLRRMVLGLNYVTVRRDLCPRPLRPPKPITPFGKAVRLRILGGPGYPATGAGNLHA